MNQLPTCLRKTILENKTQSFASLRRGRIKEIMSDKELRELDEFCAKHVLNIENLVIDGGEVYVQCGTIPGNRWRNKYSPTTDPAAAMEVLKACCIKVGSLEQVPIRWDDGQWVVGQDPNEIGFGSETGITGETLEISIALFAKNLFTK